MSKLPAQEKKTTRRQRVIYSLQPDLVAEVRRFAGAFHEGNNSGFVAAAIRSYIDRLRKVRHTARMRDSYAASADVARKVAAIWDSASALRPSLEPSSRPSAATPERRSRKSP